MEQLAADVVGMARDEREEVRRSVPKRDIRVVEAVAAPVPSEPAPVGQLDLMRKVMLALAGVVTLLWFALLAWGAVRLIGKLLF